MSDDLYNYVKQAGQFFGQRGNSPHGVTDPKDSIEVDEVDPVVEYDDPFDEDKGSYDVTELANDLPPIPVKIVAGRNTQRIKARTTRRSVPPITGDHRGRAVEILPQNENRILARIVPMSTGNRVFITTDSSVAVTNDQSSFEAVVNSNSPFITHAYNAFYAYQSHTDSWQTVCVYEEYAE